MYYDAARKRNCPFCETVVENEYHLLYVCPVYTDLRKNFLEGIVNEPMDELLKLKTNSKTLKVSRYIFRALSRRKALILE